MAEKVMLKGNGENEPKVVFHYIKSQQFRVIHADGAIGSITPVGNIHMAIYSERPAIPQRMTHKLEAGKLGEAIPSETVVREGVVREVEADVMMSLPIAEVLHEWLGQKIQELKDALRQAGGASGAKQ